MDIPELVKLCSRSWSLRALAVIAGGVTARISPVAHAAGAGRTAMMASFENLLDLGLIVRTEGHGHPLRPEFRLSGEGEAVARWAAGLDRLLEGEEDRALARRAWTLPVLAALDAPHRFNDLARALNPITDRALSQSLRDLVAHGWVARDVDAGSSPPIVRYRRTGKGAELGRHLRSI